MDVMITVMSWDIAMSFKAVEELLAMDTAVALLQEVCLGAREALGGAGGSVAATRWRD